MGLSELWGKVKGTKTFRPARIIIPQQNVEPAIKIPGPFQRNEQYFEVRVNQMYLTHSREWFSTWEPIVLVASSFIYQGKLQEVPFFIGQKTLGDKKENLPKGMIFENTKAAGLHPYKGGDFTVSVILGRAKRDDYLRRVLSIIENVSNTYLGAFGSAVLPYVNVANVVVDNFEELVGSQDIEPMIGHKITMSPDAGEGFYPGYFALINEDESEVDTSQFFVKHGKLHYGPTLASAEPYRGDDYVLYSIMAAENRSDVEALPYYKEFRKVKEFVSEFKGHINDEQKVAIEDRLIAACRTVSNSDDLTPDQMEEQIDAFYKEISTMIGKGRRLSGTRGGTNNEPREDWQLHLDKKLRALRDS